MTRRLAPFPEGIFTKAIDIYKKRKVSELKSHSKWKPSVDLQREQQAGPRCTLDWRGENDCGLSYNEALRPSGPSRF